MMQLDAREYQTIRKALRQIDSLAIKALYNDEVSMALTDAEDMRDFCKDIERIITTCVQIADAATVPTGQADPHREMRLHLAEVHIQDAVSH
jgi:hypothetical protein